MAAAMSKAGPSGMRHAQATWKTKRARTRLPGHARVCRKAPAKCGSTPGGSSSPDATAARTRSSAFIPVFKRPNASFPRWHQLAFKFEVDLHHRIHSHEQHHPDDLQLK